MQLFKFSRIPSFSCRGEEGVGKQVKNRLVLPDVDLGAHWLPVNDAHERWWREVVAITDDDVEDTKTCQNSPVPYALLHEAGVNRHVLNN